MIGKIGYLKIFRDDERGTWRCVAACRSSRNRLSRQKRRVTTKGGTRAFGPHVCGEIDHTGTCGRFSAAPNGDPPPPEGNLCATLKGLDLVKR